MLMEQLYRDNYRAIIAYIYHMSGDYHLAEDIAQDVFIKAMECTLDNCKVLSRSWFYTVARNRYLTVIRKKRRMVSLEQEELFRVIDQDNIRSNEPEEYVLGKEKSEDIQRTLLALCENYRTALVLREYMNLTLPEIAQTLGIKETYVKQLLYKARQKFKIIYGGNWHG